MAKSDAIYDVLGADVTVDIEIEGKMSRYSILTRPTESSPLVVHEKKNISFDLEELVENLGLVGGHIRIAYRGVKAAGPKYLEAQLAVQDLSFDITKLCNKSAITIACFESACSTVLSELQSAYEFLVDDYEDMAIITLSSLGELASEMRAKANELRSDFEKQERKVKTTLDNTTKLESDAQVQRESIEKEREEMKKRAEREEELSEKYEQLEKEAKLAEEKYEIKEDEQVGKLNSTVIQAMHMVGAMFVGLPWVPQAIESLIASQERSAKDAAEAFKKKRIEKIEAGKEMRKLRKKALQNLADCTAKIQHLTSTGQLEAAAFTALHSAITGLRSLSATMMQAAQFWGRLAEQCKLLASSTLQQELEEKLKKPNNDSQPRKIRFWETRPFKRQAVHYYAKWVAVHSVCHTYVQQIQVTQKDLYNYIKENPTYEEARADIESLSKQFGKAVRNSQSKMAERDFEDDEEIKKLLKGI